MTIYHELIVEVQRKINIPFQRLNKTLETEINFQFLYMVYQYLKWRLNLHPEAVGPQTEYHHLQCCSWQHLLNEFIIVLL